MARLFYKEYKTKKRAEQFVCKLRNEYNTSNVCIIEFPENGENGIYVFAVKVK